jgi:hypothetical protein
MYRQPSRVIASTDPAFANFFSSPTLFALELISPPASG